MLDFKRNEAKTVVVDLHGMTVSEARDYLSAKLSSAPAEVKEIEVIHGYRSGSALQTMVRKIRHPRVERVMLGLNQGSTVLILK